MVYNVYSVNLHQLLLECHFMRLQHAKLMSRTCEVLQLFVAPVYECLPLTRGTVTEVAPRTWHAVSDGPLLRRGEVQDAHSLSVSYCMLFKCKPRSHSWLLSFTVTLLRNTSGKEKETFSRMHTQRREQAHTFPENLSPDSRFKWLLWVF